MKNYRLITSALLIILIAGVSFNSFRQSFSDTKEKENTVLKALFPEAKLFSKKEGSPLHYKAFTLDVRTEQEILIGIAFITTDIVKDILGYAGPIKMMVAMTTDGNIKEVKVLDHTETPSYVLDLDIFLEQFLSKSIRDEFQLGVDIDGISRATITSEAITQSIEKSAKEIAQSILKIPTTLNTKPKKPFPYDQIIVPLLLFTIAVSGVLFQKTILRWTALIGGLVYFGFIKSTMVSSVQIANIFLWKLPTFEQNPLWYMLIGLTIITTFLFGMVYCGSLCPFASVQEILYKIFHHKIFRKEEPITFDTDEKLRHLKYIALYAILIISFILDNSSAASIEPFLTLFTQKASLLGWGLLILMLLAACFYFRFWCKYLCPVGACLGLIARISPFKIRLGQNCISCHKCDRRCPTRAIKMDKNELPIIDYPECILCGKCIDICPNSSLLITKNKIDDEQK